MSKQKWIYIVGEWIRISIKFYLCIQIPILLLHQVGFGVVVCRRLFHNSQQLLAFCEYSVTWQSEIISGGRRWSWSWSWGKKKKKVRLLESAHQICYDGDDEKRRQAWHQMIVWWCGQSKPTWKYVKRITNADEDEDEEDDAENYKMTNFHFVSASEWRKLK